ncbi:hypothetical protein BC939DRAFT_448654 [Gamsiella multidivaricata]|uniref:uncharacterized protein n=1 Tax=Gamsiella multidivaricata TaxID=101098 RepID=UPI00221F7DA3|nr:uncharacterized protein BC939DRAFT_448654 [Gamsiella multidivaricata]KAG0370786.1 hypothetical protein BGZ54_004035 [Gamsiella multidivaricata]KAI7825367.1 hypothetical protein BC939DRAFT_448654 [Gamsiella multidivaricata]
MATEEMSLHAAAASTSTSSIEILLTDQHMMQYTMGLSDPHDVPAKDLYEKLSFLKQQQQQRKMNIKPAHSLEESHHNSLHRQHQHQHHHCDLSIDTSNTVTSKCSSQDTLMEILQQIDHRHLQKDLEKENELELEEAATLRRHRRYKLNPDLLKDHPFTLKQNHGLANLRHS